MSDDKVTKRMGQLLRKGAALLNTACPNCNTPLLRLPDGTMYCTKCDRQVVEQSRLTSGAETRAPSSDVLNQLAGKVLTSLEILTHSLSERPHQEEIRTFATIVKDLIAILRGIQELQRQ